MDKELPVSVWSEWKIIEKIGEGSFGKVYKAQRTEKGRSFYSAIKVLNIPASKSELNSIRTETNDEKATREYFENLVEECIQEVSTMAYFRGNSHIVSVEDYKVMEYLDEIGWEINIRMEYLTSFTDYCAGKKLSEEEVIKIGIDLCKALEYCGQINIIHRDIKPENIFVSRFGDFKLGDFGIARELERSMSSMSRKGTYSYMSPEMYRGENYDRRSDIYSLGLVLFKLMNHNRLPFLSLDKQLITYRDKENALNRRISGEEIPMPVDASERFGVVIKKACAFHSSERYQSPQDMRKDLEALYEVSDMAQTNDFAENLTENSTSNAEIQTMSPEEEIDEIPLENTKKKNKKNKRKKYIPIGIAAASALVFVGVMCAGVYLKQFLEDTVRRQTIEMIELLEANQSEDLEKDAPSFAESIELIKERATIVVNNLDSYQVEGREGNKLRYYNKENQLMKALVYPSASSENVYEEYYYWNEQLFFAYIWTEHEANLYYYQDGNLIRWIDQDGESHDNEIENEEYVERGDRYWSNSVQQLY